MENEIWKPVHEARVADGKLKGWVRLNMILPEGTGNPYHAATVDIFDNMDQYWAPYFQTYFSKIHPGKKIADLLKQTSENVTRVRAELRKQIDSARL